MDISTIISKFREAALQKGDFAESTVQDHELHKQMAEAYAVIRKYGVEGTNAFRSLLLDSSPHVRSWVATVLLAEGDDGVRPVLLELAKMKGPIGLCARTVLSEYASGNLKCPIGLPGA